MSAAIFISYRRKDSEDATARLHQRLQHRFGDGFVFRDTSHTRPGDSFPEVIRAAASACRVMIAIIGAGWHSPRLMDENDWVRAELSIGLDKGVPVIPVVLRQTMLPPRSELPKPLQSLLDRSPFRVNDDPAFERDVDALAEQIAELLDPQCNMKAEANGQLVAAKGLQRPALSHYVFFSVHDYEAAASRIRMTYGRRRPAVLWMAVGLYGDEDILLELTGCGTHELPTFMDQLFGECGLEQMVRTARHSGMISYSRSEAGHQFGFVELGPLAHRGAIAGPLILHDKEDDDPGVVIAYIALEGELTTLDRSRLATGLIPALQPRARRIAEEHVQLIVPSSKGLWVECHFPPLHYYHLTRLTKAFDMHCRLVNFRLAVRTSLAAEVILGPSIGVGSGEGS